jgi:hypothetical protein
MVGLIHDAGACNSTQDCCAFCNKNDLATSGINATGAVAIMNMWGDGTGVQVIKSHTPATSVLRYDATWCKDEIARRGKCGDGYRDGRGRYYLEGLLSLLDAPTEWAFVQTSDESQTKSGGGLLYLWTHNGSHPSEHAVQTKTQTYALDIKNSTHLTIANLSFFATTIQAYDDANTTVTNDLGEGSAAAESVTASLQPMVKNLRFESLDFQYPSASRRMLKDLNPIDCMAVWTDATIGSGE